MNIARTMDLLNKIKTEDEAFLAEKRQTTAATFCAECRQNTAVGWYPFWHLYRRNLCSDCGREYGQLLVALGAGNITS